MSSQKKIVLISDGKLHFTPDNSIELSKIFGGIKFSNRKIYWEVTGTYLNGKAKLKVKDYHSTSIELFQSQTLSAKIDKVEFENLKWEEFQKFIWSYHGGLKNELLNAYIPEEGEIKEQKEHSNSKVDRTNYTPNFIIVQENSALEYEKVEVFEFPYLKSKFGAAEVLIKKEFSWHSRPITISIHNSFIIPQFDAIKAYFGKAINNKKHFTVTVTFRLLQGSVINQSATSNEIAQINEALIECVKRERIYKLATIPRIKEKPLLTDDELFDSQSSDNKNIFNQTAVDIITVLTNREGLRNKKQLQYLSGVIQSKKEKIYFTLKPLFGFLFFIEGLERNHYCWELLNSHATYIWSLDKNHKNPYNRISQTISLIQDINRQEYRKQKKLGNIDKDIVFSIIEHTGVNSANKDAFKEWEDKIKQIMD